ncbi:5'-methylthioadenosine/adenosylhomocysteine nucleosidase [Lentilactobacillus sp. IMAU92037]|uniref:5'-methylthioadenosine/adenosylhomocysteine nucleosidase n=1 Tax=Lentilactobacillus TaxID=2767893 RepID=UPI001C268924|nr:MULTISPECIES: 5'-methylthioadenosine/adenosylhomocysteine nucleosidase [Lentilactobacillus]MBU9788260.1 5'-methylthioadenosine/adenosylhomocysteine nucleosidase [Lentilactobacillus dabitei]MBV0931624.1 5'-methylthioadenosine/adenosylhomocysteine nucleosidase [Lentilactobacillus dabitei]MDM7516441.1 5'-methylthioadenosine/adenosylhomocysteine nucleosidase [Lentilactobacillus sp. TOM.63]
MAYGIICAMDEELAILKDALDNGTTEHYGHADFFIGQIHHQKMVIVKSGIGKVQAGITAAILINHFNVDSLINSGSAGGIGDGLSIGDVVVSSETAYHDVDVTAAGYKMGQLPNFPARFPADQQLEDKILKAAKESGVVAHRGLVVSGDQFVADPKVIATIKQNFPDALCSEMEGAAVGQIAYENKVPYVVIRAMSDVGDENANVNFDQFIVSAGKKSGQMLIDFFKNELLKE